MSIAVLGVCAVPLFAQLAAEQRTPASVVQRQRALEQRLREEFEQEIGPAGRTLFDWGGWYSSYLFLFDDGVESSRTLRRHDLRLWGRLTWDGGAHELYARGRLSLLDFNAGDAFNGNEDDIEGPNLERGYYRFHWGRWKAARGQATEFDVILTAGRDLVQVGSGLALAIPLDHVDVRLGYRAFELRGFWGRTVGSIPDVDLSRSATRTHRDFAGVQ
ncbi:MAG: hypothetical protein D6788_07130, partial [Planctomycetota bacterium]